MSGCPVPLNGLQYIRQLWEKLEEVVDKSAETSYTFHILRFRHLQDCLNFLRVNLQPSLFWASSQHPGFSTEGQSSFSHGPLPQIHDPHLHRKRWCQTHQSHHWVLQGLGRDAFEIVHCWLRYRRVPASNGNVRLESGTSSAGSTLRPDEHASKLYLSVVLRRLALDSLGSMSSMTSTR